jgi:hypothetical protein
LLPTGESLIEQFRSVSTFSKWPKNRLSRPVLHRPVETAHKLGKFARISPQLNVLTAVPFLENLATAAALGQVSESATTWQVFRKVEYAAGMPQDILPAASEQADPQALQWVSPQRALASHLPSVACVWRNGQTYFRHP